MLGRLRARRIAGIVMAPPVLDETHDPRRRSWVASACGHSEFPIQNLPFGIFSVAGDRQRPGVAIGDAILDLAGLQEAGQLDCFAQDALRGPCLNGLMEWPRDARSRLRRRLSELLSDEGQRGRVERSIIAAKNATMHNPAVIGDFTDFYAGIHHAENVGRLFRPDNPLLPNYKHIPIGYHGRASSIRPSGGLVVRPRGQSLPK